MIRSLSLKEFLKKPTIFLGLLGIILIVILYYIYVKRNKIKEGFMTIDSDSINLEANTSRGNNDFSSTQDITKNNVIKPGKEGDQQIFNLLGTRHYDGDTSSAHLASPQSYDKMEYAAPPDISAMMEDIKMCEKITTWDCNALNNIEFKKKCGICTGDGKTHEGKPHSGGLYINKALRGIEEAKAKTENRLPKYTASAGFCSGEIITDALYCNIQKDRSECKNATSFKDPNVAGKCSLCAFNGDNNVFVYTGSRQGPTTNFGSIKPTTFNVRLRLTVADYDPRIVFRLTRVGNVKDRDKLLENIAQSVPIGASIANVQKYSDVIIPPYKPPVNKKKLPEAIEELKGSFIPGTNTYIIDIPNVIENDELKLTVIYPEWACIPYSKDDQTRIRELQTPVNPKLVRASYGKYLGTSDPEYFKKDDPLVSDVTNYVKNTIGIKDCTKTKVNATNDGLGGDPFPGVYKQLRLAYTNDGVNFAYAYAPEGKTSTPILDANYKGLCLPPKTQVEAETEVCETTKEGQPTGRVFTQGRNRNYAGIETSTCWCLTPIDKVSHGLAGIWESLGTTARTIPLDLSVSKINSFKTPETGPPKYGTIAKSKLVKADIGKIIGIPDYLFWFWASDQELNNCEFTLVVPATLRDTTIIEDTALCPTGPLFDSEAAAAKMQAGVCERPYRGKQQVAGNISPDCVRALFLSAGCTLKGTGYPVNDADAERFLINKEGGFSDMDEVNELCELVHTLSTTGKGLNGMEQDEWDIEKAQSFCFGPTDINNACETAFKETGPHSAKCLDYLYKNAGSANGSDSNTYSYCQPDGTMAPIGADGKQNKNAIATANSKGGLSSVREYYRQIHYNANFNTDPMAQGPALKQCYGLTRNLTKKRPRGIFARYVRLKQGPKGCLQIPQLQVFDVNNVNVALNKPTFATSVSPWGDTNPAKAVDGTAKPRAHPDEFVIGNNCENPGDKDYWQVDLGSLTELSYLVYYNRTDCCSDRSEGIRVQLIDDSQNLIKQVLLKGGMVETVMFSNTMPESKWTSMPYTPVPSGRLPVRLNEQGEIECMSENNHDCSGQNDANIIDHPPSVIKPLICGEFHKKQWNYTGYEPEGHWCSIARKMFTK